MTSTAAEAGIAPIASEAHATAGVGPVLRDIARGGLTGLIVGVVGGGIGGRIAMRIAALLVPSSSGAFTENGNRIGDITVVGTLGLMVFGLAVGVFAGAIWVVVSPWIPGRGLRRGIATVPLAVAVGGIILIAGDNRDFLILDHHPAVVAVLLGLIAVIGLLFPLVDDWLDRRMPVTTPGRRGLLLAYAAVTALGTVLVVPGAINGFLTAARPSPIILGDLLLVTALATICWWILRFRGETKPPTALIAVARGALVVVAVMGVAGLIPDLSGALGIR